jgi:hypothetical protein
LMSASLKVRRIHTCWNMAPMTHYCTGLTVVRYVTKSMCLPNSAL